MFFRKSKELKEKQELINVSRKSLREAEDRVEELSERIVLGRQENVLLLEDNNRLRKIIDRIKVFLGKTEGIEKEVIDEIKELISDYHSQN